MDVQTDLSLYWSNMSICRICRVLAHMVWSRNNKNLIGLDKSGIRVPVVQNNEVVSFCDVKISFLKYGKYIFFG